MFGRQDDQSQDTTTQNDLVDEAAGPVSGADKPSGEPATPTAGLSPVTPPAATDNKLWQHPGAPLGDKASEASGQNQEQADQEQLNNIISPAGGFPKRPTYQYQAGVPSLSSTPTVPDLTTDDSANELVDIKQRALGELLPLIDKLDQPPAEKFRTIMMMIQAGDNQSLVKVAYDTAHAIEDDKERAQALLDVVNEVNYFTQHTNKNQ